MKLIKFVACGVALALLGACSAADRHDEIKKLNKKDSWNEEQTNEAIDYYLEGVNEGVSILEDVLLASEKLELEHRIERYGDEDVRKERKSEIRKAEKEFEKVRKEVDKRLSNGSSESYDEEYDEYSDYE